MNDARTCRACAAPLASDHPGELCTACKEQQVVQARMPARRRPPVSVLIREFPVTSGLVAVNVAVFLFMVVKGVSPGDPTTQQLMRWGGNFGPDTLGGQTWRLLSSCFVHAGILHLALNMWCLWWLGMFVERYLGRATFLIAYLIAGLGGAVASVWWHPFAVGVGASGAIFGAAGMLVTILRSGQLALPAEYLRQHAKSIISFIGYNLFFGFISPHIDNSAHIGGLITGALLGALLPVKGSEDSGRKVLAFGLTGILLFGGFTYAKRANAAPMAWAQGVEALKAKQYDKAAASFREAIRRDPKLADAYQDLGYVLLLQKKYAEALPVLQTATQLAPNIAGGFTNLGFALVHLNRPRDAEAPLLRAIQIDPKDADAWENLALAYAAEGKIEQARTTAVAALRLNPKLEEAKRLLDNIEEVEEPATPSSQKK